MNATFEATLADAQRDPDCDFYALRMAWAASPGYDPYADLRTPRAVVDDLMRRGAWADAARSLDALLGRAPLDIDAHLRADYVHARLGDVARQAMHRRFAEGLVGSVVTRGDGRSLVTAWAVVTTAEQYAVMNALGLESTSQRLVHEDGHAFDVHEVSRLRDGAPAGSLHFDIDLPMAALARKMSALARPAPRPA